MFVIFIVLTHVVVVRVLVGLELQNFKLLRDEILWAIPLAAVSVWDLESSDDVELGNFWRWRSSSGRSSAAMGVEIVSNPDCDEKDPGLVPAMRSSPFPV